MADSAMGKYVAEGKRLDADIRRREGQARDAEPGEPMPPRDGTAQKCPVCDGSGKHRPPTRSTIQLPPQRQCHGCQGRGWVENMGEWLIAAAMQEGVRAMCEARALVMREAEM